MWDYCLGEREGEAERERDFDTSLGGFMQFCIRIGNRLCEISIANRSKVERRGTTGVA